MYKSFLKRAFDIALSLSAILMLFLPMAFIAIAVKLTSRGPVFFVQTRVGKRGKQFKIFKFRTMCADAPKDVPTLALGNVEKWTTPFGRFLRKTGLDKLPQIFNILIGQMSFVGPRPVIEKHTELIRLRNERGASDVRPGLTGWAQINGRDRIPDSKKAELDGEYVQKLNGGFLSGIFMDMRCLLGTVPAILKTENTRAEAEENAPEEIV
jgi:O-antigen biosynthesis protein WbqP